MRLPIAWLLVIAACGTPPGAGDPADATITTDAADATELDALVTLPDGALDASPDAPPSTSLDPWTALATMPAKCRDGWCWWHPRPSGISFSHIYSTAPDNIWLVGGFTMSSIVMQWNGQEWIIHQPEPLAGNDPDQLTMSIGGTGPDNMWLLYGPTVQHWDGQAWHIRDTFQNSISNGYNGIWVDPSGAPWITTSRGKLRRWVNNAWEVLDVGCNCFLGAIFGTEANDIFFTTIGAVFHFDGQAFQIVYSGKTLSSFQGVKGDVWASGGDNGLAHWDGTAFTEITPPGIPASSIRKAGRLASDDVWWVTDGFLSGGFMHWDGATLTQHQVGLEGGDGARGNATAIIDGRWWLVGDGIYTKIGPNTVQPILEPSRLESQMWGTSQHDLYFANSRTIEHWNGTTWTTIPVGVHGITGRAGGGVGGANEVYGFKPIEDLATNEAVSAMFRFDGVSWTRTELMRVPWSNGAPTFRTPYPMRANEAMIVGAGGRALHYQDGVLAPVITGTTADLLDVWGPDPDHLYIAGADGTMLEWRRANPGIMTPDLTFPASTNFLHTIDGAGGVAWAAAALSPVGPSAPHVWMKPAGGAWTMIDVDAQVNMHVRQLSAISATNVVVLATDSARAARWNGTTFVEENYPSAGSGNLFSLPTGETFIAASAGVIMHP